MILFLTNLIKKQFNSIKNPGFPGVIFLITLLLVLEVVAVPLVAVFFVDSVHLDVDLDFLYHP